MMSDKTAYIPDEDTDTAEDVARFVRPRPPREPSQVYSVRIPAVRLEELRRLAEERDLPPSALMRDWTLDRLAIETGASPSVVELLSDRITELEQHIVTLQKEADARLGQAVQTALETVTTQAVETLADFLNANFDLVSRKKNGKKTGS
jgi:DNA-binding transcriptional MerR regulator